jgi:hypothetical protein
MRHLQLRLPNLVGIVLDPAGVRKNLPEFFLRDAMNTASTIKQNGARAGRALVDRQDE